MRRQLWFVELVIFALLISVSSLALWLQHSQAVKRISLISHSETEVSVLSDLVDNGLSQVRLEQQANQWLIHCDLIESSYPWPYCVLRFELPLENHQGWDLEQLLGIEITIRHIKAEPGQSDGLRLQLLNFDPAYAQPNVIPSLKYQGYEFTGQEHTQFIARDNIQVYTWWSVNRNNLAPEHQLRDLSNIHIIEIATGSLATYGSFVIELSEFNLVLPLISNQDRLNRILIYVWLAGGMLILGLHLLLSNLHLKEARQNQLALSQLNEQLKVKQQQLQRLASQDPLTHALNRSGFEHSIRALESSDWPLLIMLLDLDHFKQINDHFGHEMGDQVLQQFSLLLRQQIRTKDLLVRWGGEEFLIALRQSSESQAKDLCQRLFAGMQARQWPHNQPLEVSIGLAMAAKEDELDSAIQQADQAMYQQKNAGRNGFRFYQVQN